jgi:hypothetical protein
MGTACWVGHSRCDPQQNRVDAGERAAAPTVDCLETAGETTHTPKKPIGPKNFIYKNFPA